MHQVRKKWCVNEELEQVFDHFRKCYMKMLLGNFKAKLGRVNIFKPKIRQGSFHQDGNDNGVRLVKFATSKSLVVKSTMFHHRNIHKYSWTSLDGKTHNQIDHVLIDSRWNRVYLMCEVLGELILIPITIWWLQSLGKVWQWLNSPHRGLIGKDLNWGS